MDRVGFFGAHTFILGWYDDEDTAKKEMDRIVASMNSGEGMYKLKYFTDVKFDFLGKASRKSN